MFPQFPLIFFPCFFLIHPHFLIFLIVVKLTKSSLIIIVFIIISKKVIVHNIFNYDSRIGKKKKKVGNIN